MDINKIKAPSSVIEKESTLKRSFNPIKNILRNPLGYFVILGIVLCVLGFMAQKKIIPYSLANSIGIAMAEIVKSACFDIW